MTLEALHLEGLELSVVAPRNAILPRQVTRGRIDPAAHRLRVSEIQAVRGQIYFEDGAIPKSALDAQGRYGAEGDFDHWHVVVSDSASNVCGCVRLRLLHPDQDLNELHTYKVLARLPEDQQGRYLRAADAHRMKALDDNVSFGEVSGLALTKKFRRSSAGITLAVACWSVFRLLGNAMPLGTSTLRHGWAERLQGLGGFALTCGNEPLPPFYDDYFRCEMQLLGFDSRRIVPSCEPLVEEIHSHVLDSTIVAA